MAGLKVKKPITDNKSDGSLKVKAAKKEPVKDGADIAVDDKLRANWNRYLDWMDKKGIRHKTELNKGDLGNKYFRQYLKETPDSGLSEAHIPAVRKALVQYREEALKDIDAGKIGLQEGTTKENFMKHIAENEASDNPNYVGSRLTATRFPYAQHTEQNLTTGESKTVTAKNIGSSKAYETLAKKNK
jgi:hypothetical protein